MDLFVTNPYSVLLAGAIAASALYYLFGGGLGRRSRDKYSIMVGSAQPSDSTKPFRNYRIGNKKLISDFNGHTTLYQSFQAAVRANGTRNCQGSRSLVKMHKEVKEIRGQKREWQTPEMSKYKWQTFNEVSARVNALGSAFSLLGLKPRSNVALYMETRAEWTIAANAAFTQSICVMTCYANLGEEALLHGLNEAEIEHIVTSGDLLASLLGYKKDGKLPTLKIIIYTDKAIAKAETLAGLKENGVTCHTFEEAEALGAGNLQAHVPPKSEDMAVLMYTSGSTGLPKGVMCSHGNCMSAVGGVLTAVSLNPGDVHLSYLPLAHILAFVVENGVLANGVSIAYGSPRTLSDATVRNCSGDIAEAAPSFLVGVPTVFDKIKAGILTKVAQGSALQQYIFKQAFASKQAAIKVGKETPLWNAIVFKKFKGALGGRVRFIVTGGAPLSRECGEFMKVCFGVPVIQGYALTETCSGGTLGEFDDLEGHLTAGPPTCSVEMKLVDCPEMGYTHNDKPDPRGEIWIQGPNVSSGYYKNDAKTKEDFVDGWFKTGDIGRLNKNGTISIVDRKKNLIKPPHGEYIAVEHLESCYKNSPLVANIMVYASSHHNEVIALIHPNKPALESWAEKQGLNLGWAELCDSKEARKEVLASLNNTWKQTNLKSIERISAVALFPDEWTPDNGWLTAAMKLQRQQVHKTQKDVIEKLYKELE